MIWVIPQLDLEALDLEEQPLKNKTYGKKTTKN